MTNCHWWRQTALQAHNNPGSNRRGTKKRILSLIVLLMLSLSAGCNRSNTKQAATSEPSPAKEIAATPQTPQADKMKIVTTFLPMYWFTRAVVGDTAEVQVLVPPGTEIHEYQATPENVQAIATADVLVKNGLGLEEFLDDTIKNAQNSKLSGINASKGIKPLNDISPVEHISQAGEEHDHEHAEGNPHVWLDPVLVKQQVNNIRDGLIAANPANKAVYEANATAYIKQLESLDNEFQQTLQKTPNCAFITFHDAYPYLAQRYNLKQVAVVEIPEDQLTPTDVQNAVNAVKKYNVKVLFSEPGVDNKLLTSLSQDLNLKLNSLDSLETGDRDPQYYFKAMKTNLNKLESACNTSS